MSAALAAVFTRHPAGVSAVLDAADAARDELSDAQYVASFAPAITSYRSCVCGRVMEKRGTDMIAVTDDEKLAAAEAVGECLGRPLDDFALMVVTHVLHAINHERAVADADADRDWDDAHAGCEYDQ